MENNIDKLKEITPPFFCKMENFINKNNEHPKEGLVIGAKNIIFDKEEFLDNNWLFCLNDERIIEKAKKSLNKYMVPHNLSIVIQKERKIKRNSIFNTMQMESRKLHIIAKYKSFKKFEKKFKDRKDLIEFFEEDYKGGDKILHHNDFDIAPNLYEREALLLVRKGMVIKSCVLKMS